jgi:hypothetical protein
VAQLGDYERARKLLRRAARDLSRPPRALDPLRRCSTRSAIAPTRSTPAWSGRAEKWFLSFQGSIGYEIRDLSITTGDDVAFSRSLNRISGRRTNGEQTDVWVRATVCFRKIAGKWKVVPEHVSVPFYMEPPYRASLDLKP